VVADPADVPGIARLGPEALGISLADFAAVLKAAGGRLKHLLTDQEQLAGVGNAYSDEALHVAKLSPYKDARRLTDDEMARLHGAVQQVLGDAVDRSRDVPAAGLKSEKKSGLRVHGRAGQPCPECGDTVREVSFATKSFQYCPTCQTGGKPLADRRLSRLIK
jgi:formamidopyrimidine-DNA glycosylase